MKGGTIANYINHHTPGPLMSEPKIKFRDELDRFAKERFGSEIAKLNDKQRSDTLTLCYLLNIRAALLPGSIPDDLEELQSCICDGKSDRAVDFLYRDDNNHVTIIQAKHRGAGKSESESEFEAFRACLKRLCPDTRPETQINQKLLDLISEIDWENDTFTLIYLSLARESVPISASAEREIENLDSGPFRDISSRTELLYMSEDELNKAWRDVAGKGAGTPPTIDILLAESKPNASESSFLTFQNHLGTKSYIAVLSAQQIHHLYTRHRDKLFNLNIRNYIGDTRTNKDIIRTARESGDNFFFFNNGISAVATKIKANEVTGGTELHCENFSVINGAQTFRSISKAHAGGDKSQTKRLRVLIRISEIDFLKNEAAELLDNITRYNNTQNSMKVSDFRSNDSVQSSLVRYTSHVPAYGGKNFVYRNKRSQIVDRNKINVKMDEFCRSVYAYQFGPADMFGGLPHLYDTGTEGGYVKLFGRDLEPLPQIEFDRLFGIWLIVARADELLKEEKKALSKKDNEHIDEADVLRKAALERKYLAFFALGETLREVCRLQEKDESDMLRSFSKPRWQDDKAKLKFVDDAFGLACDIVVQVYQAAKGRGTLFVHRNFFRDIETLNNIKSAKAARKSNFQSLIK